MLQFTLKLTIRHISFLNLLFYLLRNHMKVCFFTTSSFQQVKREQYTYLDYKILNELGYNVIFANKFQDIPWDCDLYFSWWASGSIIPLFVAIITRKPIIVIAGGNEATLYKDSISGIPAGYLAANFLKRFLTRFVIRHSTLLIAVSNFMLPSIKKLGRPDPIVIYNCVDTEIFSPDSNEKKQYILTSFTLNNGPVELKRGKNILLAAALVLKKHSNLEFVVVGHKGDAYNELITMCNNLNIKDNIKFIGSIENSKMASYLQKAICYLQPSDTETFGVAVVEAMSTGIPVVVSRNGALPEVVSNHGIFIDHNDPTSIAEGILTAFEMDIKKRAELALKCRNHVIKNFTYLHRKNKIHSAVKKALNSA